jgi:hypothetical protein
MHWRVIAAVIALSIMALGAAGYTVEAEEPAASGLIASPL